MKENEQQKQICIDGIRRELINYVNSECNKYELIGLYEHVYGVKLTNMRDDSYYKYDVYSIKNVE